MELQPVIKYDDLKVITLEDRQELGAIAAAQVVERILNLLQSKDELNIIFAAAPSQNEFLAALRSDVRVPWNRINAFHMDEYLGLPDDAPQRFGSFLKEALFKHVAFQSVNYINGNPADIDAECRRYGNLIASGPPDIVCMGIGENTHIAFNEPNKAKFNDKVLVKPVTLDPVCRQQQVNDKCFNNLNEVPQKALTLTVPALLSAPFIYCMVPGKNKARAVMNTLIMPITEQHPSTILRKHPNATLFLDRESAKLI